MAQKQFKIGLSNTDKQNMAQDVYERVLALTFNEYDTTTEYEVGDFVVYNNQLYKCIGATSGAWDSSKWQLATLNDLVDDIENAVQFVNDKANVDGNYPTMTVGAADNLTPYDEDSGTDQEQPFLLQGTGCGNGEQQVDTGALGLLKEKQGHSVVVNNQGVEITGQSFLIWDGLKGTVQIDNSQGSSTRYESLISVNVIQGHKYLLLPSKVNNGSPLIYLTASSQSNLVNGGIAEATLTGGYAIYIAVLAGETVNVEIQGVVVDLTQWFGSNDNIPAHLLAHPEDFFRYYQGSLAYNEGTLVNANGRYLKTIGRNQWDEEWELGVINQETGGNQSSSTAIRSKNYIRVIPNTDYYFKHPGLGFRLFFYDKDYNMIENKSQASGTTVKTQSNCCYIRFYLGASYGTTYNHDITISIYYEDESGYDEYYPYEELANIDTGTEILRSAGSVADIKLPDGTIKRNIGVVDLGTLNWEYAGTNTFYVVYSGIKLLTENMIVSNGYTPIALWTPFTNTDKAIHMDDNGQLYIKDSAYTDATAFKTAMDGIYLYYELAEPTTEQGTTFSENVAIDDFGSMDFGGTNGVPQGASIFYAVDYKAFIDSLYNTLDGDATDIVKESELDSKLATLGYVKLTSVSGYDATKTQVLKNVEGTLTWVTEE